MPHFEKMLYDNALLIDLLTWVWLDTGDPLYAARVDETVAWALREMRASADGKGGQAFASAFDADSEGVEGKFYVWTEAEIDALLKADSPAFKQAYDVTSAGNWEGRTILNRSSRPDSAGDGAPGDKLARCREKLFAARRDRVAPGRDHKVLADWNGMMIAALANAGAAFDKAEWQSAGEAAFSFVCRNMMRENGRLFHSWCAGRPGHDAVLDDYASMSRAALALFEAMGNVAYLDRAKAWVNCADAHYWDENGGYFFTAEDSTDPIVRPKIIADNATPAGNGVMAEVLARLFHHTGDDRYRRRAADLFRTFSAEAPEPLVSHGSLLNGFELMEGAVRIDIAGDPCHPATQALLRAVHQAPLPTRVLSLNPAREATPATTVCADQACGPPFSDPEALSRELSRL